MTAEARAAGRDIIDFGMGNPDRPAPDHVVAKLVETVQDPRTHRYSTSRGIPGLRRALAAYYDRRFGVDLDPESEVIVNIGSKEGLVNLAQAITSPGDVVIAPNPTYPIHTFGFMLAGAAIRHIPLTDDHDYLGELERAVRHSVPSPSALLVNFPANPTGHFADSTSTAGSSRFAAVTTSTSSPTWPMRRSITTAGPPPSILQVPGAKEIAVEFYLAQSKTYSMPGWRIGCRGRQPAHHRRCAGAGQVVPRLRHRSRRCRSRRPRRSTDRRTASRTFARRLPPPPRRPGR